MLASMAKTIYQTERTFAIIMNLNPTCVSDLLHNECRVLIPIESTDRILCSLYRVTKYNSKREHTLGHDTVIIVPIQAQ